MYTIQPNRVAYKKPIKLKFCAQFKINIQKREGLSNSKKPVFDFSLLYSRKSGLRRKSLEFLPRKNVHDHRAEEPSKNYIDITVRNFP